MKYLTGKRHAIVRNMLHTINLDLGAGITPITKESIIADVNTNGINSCDLPYADNSFDSVTALELFEHLDMNELLCTMHEIDRVLKSGGQLIISFPNYKWYMYAFQNITWWFRIHTTLNYKGKGHINMQPPQHYRNIMLYFGYDIMEEKRVYLYDYIIRAIKN